MATSTLWSTSAGGEIRGACSTPLEKNYNSGGVVAGETARDARTAHVTLYHDADHPSALEIPLGR